MHAGEFSLFDLCSIHCRGVVPVLVAAVCSGLGTPLALSSLALSCLSRIRAITRPPNSRYISPRPRHKPHSHLDLDYHLYTCLLPLSPTPDASLTDISHLMPHSLTSHPHLMPHSLTSSWRVNSARAPETQPIVVTVLARGRPDLHMHIFI